MFQSTDEGRTSPLRREDATILALRVLAGVGLALLAAPILALRSRTGGPWTRSNARDGSRCRDQDPRRDHSYLLVLRCRPM